MKNCENETQKIAVIRFGHSDVLMCVLKSERVRFLFFVMGIEPFVNSNWSFEDIGSFDQMW